MDCLLFATHQLSEAYICKMEWAKVLVVVYFTTLGILEKKMKLLYLGLGYIFIVGYWQFGP